MDPHPIVEAIDAALEAAQNKEHRRHLGASIIGNPCSRQLWLGFRWCTAVEHKGRLLRLFNRGKKEEDRILEWLQAAGIQIWQNDPATGAQFRITGYKGHFGGELDGVGKGVIDGGPYLLEFKTHNDKSFVEMVRDGLQKSKFTHYVQMQMYMGAMKLPQGVYLAVNKNTDELYAETVVYDADTFQAYSKRAEEIIDAPEPPPRISRDPTYYLCKWCEHHAICHQDKAPQVNCRTCYASTPIEGGVFQCEKDHPAPPQVIPIEVECKGCSNYKRHPLA